MPSYDNEGANGRIARLMWPKFWGYIMAFFVHALHVGWWVRGAAWRGWMGGNGRRADSGLMGMQMCAKLNKFQEELYFLCF